MVEPITSMTAGMIATLVATKAFEKTGEKVSDAVWSLVGKFLDAIRKKDATTATEIEAAAQTLQLSEQKTKELTTKVEELVSTDPVIKQAAQAIQTAVQAQPGTIVNLTKLAEKIGVVNQGTINNQINTISF